jgi:D-alanyl-D-alanine carboxypeptidase
MKRYFAACACLFAFLVAAGCDSAKTARLKEIKTALDSTSLDPQVAVSIYKRVEAGDVRFFSLLDAVKAAMAADPALLRLVDKRHTLPADFVPADLVALDGAGIPVSREGHKLRKPAAAAMKTMCDAARAAGVTLTVSSAYRSYEYQKNLFARNVAEMGQPEALRVSAPPGASQHQLGTAADFGSITDEFAGTAAGRWVAANAGRYGFSLSFPRGMEPVTGYLWESWHFRYIGKDAAALQEEYFGGVQHYLIVFLDALSRAPRKG